MYPITERNEDCTSTDAIAINQVEAYYHWDGTSFQLMTLHHAVGAVTPKKPVAAASRVPACLAGWQCSAPPPPHVPPPPPLGRPTLTPLPHHHHPPACSAYMAGVLKTGPSLALTY
mgnify:CR=1 FL=1